MFVIIICLKQNVLSTTKFGGAETIFRGNCPRISPCVCGPGQNRRQKVFHWGPSCLCRRARHSENLFLIHNMNSICSLCKLGLITNIFGQQPIIGS